MYWFVLMYTVHFSDWCGHRVSWFTPRRCHAATRAFCRPYKFSKHKGSAFPMGSADTANDDGRRGSNVYEVNHWLWMFGRCKPRLGGLSVAETAVRISARHEEQVKRAVETRRRRTAAKASSK